MLVETFLQFKKKRDYLFLIIAAFKHDSQSHKNKSGCLYSGKNHLKNNIL